MIYKNLLGIDYLIIQYPIAISPTDQIGDIYRLATTQDIRTDHTTADGRTWMMVYAGDWIGCYETMEEARAMVQNPPDDGFGHRKYEINKAGHDWYHIVDLRHWMDKP